jgi:hypothetical protein
MGREPMNTRDISEAKDPDLRASVAAMHRAAKLTRKIAIQTDTDLIVRVHGKLTHIPSKILREEVVASAGKST